MAHARRHTANKTFNVVRMLLLCSHGRKAALRQVLTWRLVEAVATSRALCSDETGYAHMHECNHLYRARTRGDGQSVSVEIVVAGDLPGALPCDANVLILQYIRSCSADNNC